MKVFALTFLTSIIFLSCSKDPSSPAGPGSTAVLPTITTAATSSITSSSAISGGNVTSDGGDVVTSRGVCWNTSSNPVATGNHTSDGTGTGTFSSMLAGLPANTTYYVRAYAVNSAGTAYGNELSFTTSAAPLIYTDSAKMILVTGTSGSNTVSLFNYDMNFSKKWEMPLPFSVIYFNKPEYAGGNLFVAYGGSLSSLNANNAFVNWSYTIPANMMNARYVNDTIVTASTLIAPSAQNVLLLLNKSTGAAIWNLPTPSLQTLVTPLLDAGKLYALSTNSTGTAFTLSCYDIFTKSLLWQRTTNSFLSSVPQVMLIRSDTLIVEAPTGTLTSYNKNTGNVIWTKGVSTNYIHVYSDKFIYSDLSTGGVAVLSMQTGTVTLQGEPINFMRSSTNLDGSYIYNNAFYCSRYDSVYCIGLTDGLVKWRRRIRDFNKFICIEHLVYGIAGSATGTEFKLMVMNAADLSLRDSITIPKPFFQDLSILSAKNKYY